MRSEIDQVKRLYRMINSGKLPGFGEIDWSDALYYWTHRGDQPKRKYPRKPLTREESYFRRADTINRRALAKGQTGVVSGDDLLRIMEASNNECKFCEGKENLVFDHIIPYYRGGTNQVVNLQVLCRRCNMEKGVL